MIDHIHFDGSRGHEYEVGDRVATLKPGYGSLHRMDEIVVKVGTEGTVTSIEPYDEKSTFRTSFIRVKMDNGEGMKNLMPSFEPRCEPRIEKPVVPTKL